MGASQVRTRMGMHARNRNLQKGFKAKMMGASQVRTRMGMPARNRDLQKGIKAKMMGASQVRTRMSMHRAEITRDYERPVAQSRFQCHAYRSINAAKCKLQAQTFPQSFSLIGAAQPQKFERTWAPFGSLCSQWEAVQHLKKSDGLLTHSLFWSFVLLYAGPFKDLLSQWATNSKVPVGFGKLLKRSSKPTSQPANPFASFKAASKVCEASCPKPYLHHYAACKQQGAMWVSPIAMCDCLANLEPSIMSVPQPGM
eukprot:1159230-Pelagomonas_calceolata.AAC.4